MLMSLFLISFSRRTTQSPGLKFVSLKNSFLRSVQFTWLNVIPSFSMIYSSVKYGLIFKALSMMKSISSVTP